jgi:ribonuclease Y
MNPYVFLAVGIAVGSVIGIGVGIAYWRMQTEKKSQKARSEAEEIIAKAKEEGREILKEFEQKAEEECDRKLKKFDRELNQRRQENEKFERKLTEKQSALDRKLSQVDKQEKDIQARESELTEMKKRLVKEEQSLEQIRLETKRRCEEVSGLTEDEAKKLLLETLETDVRNDAAALVRRIEAETKESAERKARQIITVAVQRCAAEQISESTVSVVQLPNDEVKGKIIGREGRNIRALEAATGCNIIVDDTPEAVVLSCFDPIRREVARLTLEKMLQDGRIHPGRIEEVVAKVEKNLQDTIRQAGEQACFDLGLADMHPELSRVLGRLKYRTSYGQNILNHSIEVAWLCSMMAGELGADPHAAKRAGLLHDIGKALTHEMEGTHALIGADLAKKYNEAPGVVHAVAAHHNEVEPRTIIAVLVQAADALSSARPGARREMLETYVKRLRDIEAIADSFKGVTKAYAIQAGREIRIAVEPTEVNDNEASLIARDVSKRIERELQYPGQIKVTVCRESRFTEYAK